MTLAELAAALEASTAAGHTTATFQYVSATGVPADRTVFVSAVRLWYGRTLRHPDWQWLADELGHGMRVSRTFAVRNMADWRSV